MNHRMKIYKKLLTCFLQPEQSCLSLHPPLFQLPCKLRHIFPSIQEAHILPCPVMRVAEAVDPHLNGDFVGGPIYNERQNRKELKNCTI